MKRTFPFLLLTSSFLLFTFSFFLLTSCSSATPIAAPAPITVQYTAATTPWLTDLYACAGNNIVDADLRSADFLDPESVDMVMRVGQPPDLPSPAYQISTDDILVIVNRQNPINQLTPDQVRGLFTGQVLTWKDINSSDAPVQVWVFPSGEDIQQIFEQAALGGAPIASGARLANTPDEMSQAIANDVNTVGILTRHWKAGNVSDMFTVTTVPVLAIPSSDPRGVVQQVVACLQK
jgi:hypothetical protein